MYGGTWEAMQGMGQTVGGGWCVKQKSYGELMNDSEKHCHSNAWPDLCFRKLLVVKGISGRP